jgi:hypothetical protein
MNSFLLQKISPGLAFLFLLVLSFASALFLIGKANEIIDASKDSASFNITKRQAATPDGTKFEIK